MQLRAAGNVGLAAVLTALAGCSAGDGAATAPVSGMVTLQGQPLAGVSVAFVPQQGRPASGLTDAEGRFTLSTFETGDGAVVGQHKVIIAEPPNDAEPMPGEPGWEKWKKKPKQRFPAKYSDPEKSGFTAEVKADGENEFTFAITN